MLTLIKQMVQLHPDLTELIEKMQSVAPKQQRIPFNPELHCRQVKAKMDKYRDQTYLLNSQYKDATNFGARVDLHRRFSVKTQVQISSHAEGPVVGGFVVRGRTPIIISYTSNSITYLTFFLHASTIKLGSWMIKQATEV